MWGGAGPDDETIWEKTPLVWQVPMVISPSMPVGQFVVGAFAQSTILFSREVLTMEIAFQNEDDFLKNFVCLRGELRSGLAVPVPARVFEGDAACWLSGNAGRERPARRAERSGRQREEVKIPSPIGLKPRKSPPPPAGCQRAHRNKRIGIEVEHTNLRSFAPKDRTLQL